MHCRPVFTFVVLVAVCAAVVMPAARAVGEEEVTPVPEAEAADEPDIREIVANRKPIPPGTHSSSTPSNVTSSEPSSGKPLAVNER